jgi:AraC-like DNA-binding protein
VINPGQVHWGGPAEARGCTYRIFYPDCAVVQAVLDSVDEAWPGVPYFGLSRICDRTLAQRLHHLFNTLETGASSPLESDSYLTTTLTHLITHYANPSPQLPRIGPEKQAIQQVRDYLETHYSQNIALQELADLVQFKPLRLLRTFRKELGLPPHAYLVQVRVTQAKVMLAQGYPIIEVALHTGFADQSHLTRHFKRFVGVTPGQYVAGCGEPSNA